MRREVDPPPTLFDALGAPPPRRPPPRPIPDLLGCGIVAAIILGTVAVCLLLRLAR